MMNKHMRNHTKVLNKHSLTAILQQGWKGRREDRNQVNEEVIITQQKTGLVKGKEEVRNLPVLKMFRASGA